MNYLDHNEFLTKEILPEVNSLIKEYIESEFSYIENEEDLKDLEEAEISDELFNEVLKDLTDLVNDVKNEYDFSKIDEDFDKDELYSIIESSFNDYRELMIEKYLDEFDRIASFNDYFDESEY